MMHQQALDALIRRANAVAHEMVHPVPLPQAGQRIIGGQNPATAFTLTKHGHRLFVELVSRHLYELWSARYSMKYIEAKMRSMLLEAAKELATTPVETGVRRLAAEYEAFNSTYQIILPLVGVRIEGAPLRLGKATLRNYDDTVHSEVRDRCHFIIQSNPSYSVDAKDAYLRELDKKFLSTFRGIACSEVLVTAEPNRAREIALEATRLAIDLLRYSILFLFDDERPRTVGVLGDVSRDSRVAMAIHTDNQACVFHSELTHVPLTLNEEAIAAMRNIGVFELSDLIEKDGRTEFEDVVLRAAHWLASAQTQNENENALLNLVTCLETFFKPESGAPITATIAEGVAMLTANALKERTHRKNRVAYFYGKRSKLTHEGDGTVTDADLRELTCLCRDMTLLMIRHKASFSFHKDFRVWLEGQKLGAVVRFPT